MAQKTPQKNAIVDNVVNVDSVSEKQPTIIICADNDGIDSDTAKAVKKVVENLQAQPCNVFVAEPSKPDATQKWDFNDALKAHGVDVVRQDLEKTLRSIDAIKINPVNTSLMSETNLSMITSANNEQDCSSGKLNASAINEEPRHAKTLIITPEKEVRYHDVLKAFQQLRNITKKNKTSENIESLLNYAHRMSQAKIMMGYIKEKYPKLAENVHALSLERDKYYTVTPEKETQYKKILKRYTALREKCKKDSYKLPVHREHLLSSAEEISKNKQLMHYTKNNYPKLAENI